jgi:hypothetical protein
VHHAEPTAVRQRIAGSLSRQVDVVEVSTDSTSSTSSGSRMITRSIARVVDHGSRSGSFRPGGLHET